MKKRMLVIAAAVTATMMMTCPVMADDFKVGICNYVDDASLNQIVDNIQSRLEEIGEEKGVTFDVSYDNCNADANVMEQIISDFQADNVDLMVGVATPVAMRMQSATEGTDTPVVFSAVSDPVGAGLANADGSPVGNITGTSDALAVDAQLKMIREILPDAKKIGILYTTSEANSVSTIEQYKEAAGSYGFEIVDSGINTIADVDLAAADLVTKVDCITNLTDNTVVSALQTVIAKATDAGIPVFGSEVEQVKAGCVASMGLEYFELGKQTGHMAAKVLKGEAKASEMNYEVISEPSLYVNTAAADKVSLALDDDFVASAYEKFDEIIVE